MPSSSSRGKKNRDTHKLKLHSNGGSKSHRHRRDDAHACKTKKEDDQSNDKYLWCIGRRRLNLIYTTAAALAFAFGRFYYRFTAFHSSQMNLPSSSSSRQTILPKPQLSRTESLKRVPPTFYTSYFDSSAAGDSIMLSKEPQLDTASTVGIATENHNQNVLHSFDVSLDGVALPSQQNVNSFFPSTPTALGEDSAHTLPGPSGQHLLVDIENVNGDFLDSEEQLAEAILATVALGNLTLLSYHCHGMVPFGVSCVGVLLNGHLSFHTWPIPGVITLDLFTCEDKPLLRFVEYLHQLFGLPKATTTKDDDPDTAPPLPHSQWAFKKRGYDRRRGSTSSSSRAMVTADDDDANSPSSIPHKDDDNNNPKDVELDEYIVGRINYKLKEKVVFLETKYQTVEIFDIIDPRRNSLEQMKKSQSSPSSSSPPPSYESLHPELFRPDRILFLDQIMQSRRYGEAAYHEALVHPAMFVHPHPTRVAIIGGGEGATLREVLKHTTVESVTMIEIDEAIVNISRTWLPEWSDCSNFLVVGDDSSLSCFDDPRIEQVYYQDAVAWFVERFAVSNNDVKDEDRFDVIIMDALDPSSIADFSDFLYESDVFLKALANALKSDGVLAAQTGISGFITNSAPREYTRTSVLDNVFIPRLVENGFAKVKSFTEAYGGFWENWSFLVAFKDTRGNEKWYRSEAFTDLEIRKRIAPSLVEGESLLRFFDGALMKSFSYPPRHDEEAFCRKSPTPPYCNIGPKFDSMSALATPPTNSFLLFPSPRRLVHEMGAKVTGSSKWRAVETYPKTFGSETTFYGDVGYVLNTDAESGSARPGCVHGEECVITGKDESNKSIAFNPFFDRNHLKFIASPAASAVEEKQ